MGERIDIHAHVKHGTDTSSNPKPTAEQLFELYARLKIERGGILPILPVGATEGMFDAVHAREIAQAHPDRFFWYTTVDLQQPTVCETELYDYLAEQKRLGAVGVGEVVSKMYLDDARALTLFACCEALSLPVLCHLSPGFAAPYGLVDDLGLPRLERVLKQFPRLKYIGHAKPFWNEISVITSEEERKAKPVERVREGRMVYLMRQYENLYGDLSAQSGACAMCRDREYAAAFLTEFADRILYGCDICSVTNTHPHDLSDLLDRLRQSGEISEAVYQKVCRENAIRLFGLSV